MRRAFAWAFLAAGFAALYVGAEWLACMGIIGWLVLLANRRTTWPTSASSTKKEWPSALPKR